MRKKYFKIFINKDSNNVICRSMAELPEWITSPSIEYSGIFINDNIIYRSMPGLPEPISSRIKYSGIFINNSIICRNMAELTEWIKSPSL